MAPFKQALAGSLLVIAGATGPLSAVTPLPPVELPLDKARVARFLACGTKVAAAKFRIEATYERLEAASPPSGRPPQQGPSPDDARRLAELSARARDVVLGPIVRGCGFKDVGDWNITSARIKRALQQDEAIVRRHNRRLWLAVEL